MHFNICARMNFLKQNKEVNFSWQGFSFCIWLQNSKLNNSFFSFQRVQVSLGLPSRPLIIGSLSKPRRQRQQERHQTKGLMSRTIAVHVCYKSLYISLPSSAKLEREMTKFSLVYRTWTTTANFWYFHLELNAVVVYWSTIFRTIGELKRSRQTRITLVKYNFIFYLASSSAASSSLLKLPNISPVTKSRGRVRAK